MCREDTCHVVIGTLLEYQSIEEAVDKIAQRAGKDEGCTHDEVRMIVFFDDPLDIEAAEQYGYEAKEGQKEFSPAAAEL